MQVECGYRFQNHHGRHESTMQILSKVSPETYIVPNVCMHKMNLLINIYMHALHFMVLEVVYKYVYVCMYVC